jgi:hypothetical protein
MLSGQQREEIVKRLELGETDAARIGAAVGVSKMQVAAVKAWCAMRRDLPEKQGTTPAPESSTSAKASSRRAISIRQPYVEMILRGTKTEEYRSRRTLIRGEVYLYASLKPCDDSEWQKVGLQRGDLPTGKIVGTVEIKDCHLDETEICYVYVLENPKRLQRHLRPTNQPQPCFWRPQF